MADKIPFKCWCGSKQYVEVILKNVEPEHRLMGPPEPGRAQKDQLYKCAGCTSVFTDPDAHAKSWQPFIEAIEIIMIA